MTEEQKTELRSAIDAQMDALWEKTRETLRLRLPNALVSVPTIPSNLGAPVVRGMDNRDCKFIAIMAKMKSCYPQELADGDCDMHHWNEPEFQNATLLFYQREQQHLLQPGVTVKHWETTKGSSSLFSLMNSFHQEYVPNVHLIHSFLMGEAHTVLDTDDEYIVFRLNDQLEGETE